MSEVYLFGRECCPSASGGHIGHNGEIFVAKLTYREAPRLVRWGVERGGVRTDEGQVRFPPPRPHAVDICVKPPLYIAMPGHGVPLIALFAQAKP